VVVMVVVVCWWLGLYLRESTFRCWCCLGNKLLLCCVRERF